MTPLHACILLRDFKSFQRVLNVHGRSNQTDDHQLVKARRTSGAELADTCLGDVSDVGGQLRSPTKQSNRKLHTADEIGVAVNVNDKDTDGRTALHLACSLPDCLEYVRLLLKHPLINVNVHDAESHYTPLHRAMYVANLPAALLLLQRPDIDVTLKDYEGYSAFDLYNSTIEGTKPDQNDPDADLFMWGTNVNATLGFSDGNNRSHPDQIVLQPKEYASFPPEGPTVWDSFSPIHVRQVGMSKLHTVVVTSEGSSVCNIDNVGGGNLRVCGLGSSGRLGLSPFHYHLTHQNVLSPLPSHSFSSNVHITKVAVGQDHTLALTQAGEVYSWGLNRFAQLGYVIKTAQGEPSSGAGGHDENLGNHGGKNDRTDATGRGNSVDDTIQQTPRRILDALRKEVVLGIAASKMASACWTAKGELFTWGTNSGQLGYERSSYPQIYPRKVSKIVGRVVDVALSDTAMACLVSTGDVICVWNDKETKINFPLQTFPAKIQPYRPPQALRDAGIAKLTCCDDVFSALSLNGEVFVFTAPDGNIGGSEQASASRTALIKPQRAWVLKKKYRAVKDVALGSNGNIIVCTESGHVFVRTRAQPIKVASSASLSSDRSGTLPGSGAPGSFTSSSLTGHGSTITAQTSKVGTNFTFVRVPCLQRVTKVCANSTGAFGALKVDYRHAPITIVGNGIAEDLKELMPFAAMYGREQWQRTKKGGRFGLGHSTGRARSSSSSLPVSSPGDVDADDADLEDIKADILQLKHLCEIIEQEKKKRKEQDNYTRDRRLPFDADVMVVSQSDAAFPAHRVILAARSTELYNILAGGRAVKDDQTNICVRFAPNKGKAPITTATTSVPRSLRFPTCGKLIISGCHTLTVLVLLNYLYSDELLAIWDPRIKTAIQQECARIKAKPDQVKTELQTLMRLLHLPMLAEVLDVSVKRAPTPSMAKDMEALWVTTQGDSLRSKLTSVPFPPDVVLQLADREVSCHSVLLRARSDLFASFFGEEVWTTDRRDDQGVIKVDMRHLKWHTMQYVFRFMFCGMEEAQFDRLDFAHSVDDVLDFMFSVMAAATELLLDRLVLICSSIILKYTNIQNACYILNDATHYNAKELVERLQTYLLVNLETMLEQRMLDALPHRLAKQLAAFARQKQAEKSPRSRTTVLVDVAMAKHAKWLSLQDIPAPIIRLSRPQGWEVDITSKRSRLSLGPVPLDSRVGSGGGFTTSQRTIRRPPSGEDIFMMDDAEGPSVTIEPPVKTLGWKAQNVPRVDMKSLMAAEAAAAPTPLSRKAAPPISRTGSKDSITPSPGPSVSHGSSTSWRIPANPSLTPTKPTLPSTPPVVHGSMTPRKPEGAPPGTSPREIAHIPTTPTKSQSPSVTSPARTQRPPSQAAKEKDSRPLNLGPIITPTKQPSKTTTTGPPSIRRVSSKAWALPAVEPVIGTSSPPLPSLPAAAAAAQVAATSSGGGCGVSSFVAIQQLQLEQASAGLSSKDNKRSLREIQAEEETRQQEQDFLRWWAAEEERVRLESDAALSRAMADSARVDGGSSSKGRRKPHAGKKSSTKDGKPPVTGTRDPNPAAGHGIAATERGAREDRRPKPRAAKI
ncbi:hypothetical protein M378DRAFT_130290 [Amanita muscaria Koide BX008]|uniref:BTB domain-containing protein n=1 Tax=Amanita muscaria (strain Koide BX008) TaxID=946122 RepID=A0A0C2SCX8_AMAMK|nr:hypothetical protein M378DRAFT_130290 [Amanita muscaria Koide BX008]